ncbi:MAG: YbaK/EbsC family protein, partial [Verrucomicrobiota bacterium]|nr:YbaK/EbsC family protein [Verrucomicrobiota bacterium]
LELKPENTGKAVFYSDLEKNMYFVVIRGDIEVNVGKLKKIIGTNELEFASDEHIREIGAEPGYASPINVHGENVIVIFDHSAAESSNLVVGANEKDYHYKNFNFDRDMNAEDVKVVDIATARNGDPCPVTGEPLVEKRGIEVGNIFQLGTKYTKPMGCTFLDQNGISKDMIMGCYGIGVGRSMAAVVEQSHDKFGPIWPISIAPFQVHICALNINKEGVKEAAEKLYSELTDAGLEVILDDRKEKAGFMFNDADLIGAPHRLVISARNLEEGEVEYRTRASRDKEMLKLENVVEEVEKRVKVDLKKYR